MGNLNEFFRDLGRNAYGLGENVASLASAAIAEPVAGYAAMYDPANGANAIREGMTYKPRTEAGQMYQQGAAKTLGAMVQPAMPVIDTWQQGVDIAGRYSPTLGALLKTTPTALGVALGAKPAMQTGRQISNSLGAMQSRMVANANAPRTLNTGYMGQRGAINPSDFNLVTNPDGTVTLYHGTTKQAAQKIIQEKKLLSAGEPDVYMTSDPMAGYGDGTTVKFKIDPKHINLDDEFPSGRVDFRMPAAKGWRIQNPEINTPKRPLTEFEQSHLLAQQRAALPVSQGGLGLAPDNTAMDRARAMGFDGEGVHYTPNDFDAFREGKGDYSAVWVTTDPKVNLAAHNIGRNGEMIEGTNGMPLLFNNQKRVTATDKWDNDITSNFPDNVSELDAQKLKALGFTHGVMGTQAAILDPKNIRSRFAAFDPFNRDSSNLLAQSAKFVPATTLGAYMANEKRKDEQNRK